MKRVLYNFARPWHLLTVFIYVLLVLSSVSCSLLNSGTVNLKYTDAKAKFNGVHYENDEKIKDISFSIKTIQHPELYHRWDMNFRLTPSIHLDHSTFITEETFTNAQGNQESYPTIQMTRLMGFANLKMNIHTPAGGFLLGVGFGGSVYKMTDSTGFETTKTRELKRVDLAYIVFLSRKFFLYIGPRYIHDSYEQYILAIRLGIFWNRI